MVREGVRMASTVFGGGTRSGAPPLRERRIRHSRTLDLWLLSTLLPLYLLIQLAAVRAYDAQPWLLPFYVAGAQGTAGYPLVILAAPDSSVRAGDHVTAIRGLDVRGLSASD